MTLRQALRSFARDRERDWIFTGCCTALFFVYLVWMHFHHEMWRDEIHSWTLSRLAQGFADLVTGDRRYEGHPPLWFWYLHIWSWLTKESWGIQAATITAGTAAAMLLLRFAPFPRYLKVLLLCSYYIGYEYTVLSRNYVLGWLFLCLVCAAYHPIRFRYLLVAAGLSLLGLTSVYGLILCGCLLGYVVLDQTRLSASGSGGGALTISVSSGLMATFLIVSGAMVFCAAVLQPSEPNVFAPDWHFQYLTLDAVPRMLIRILAGFLPLRHYAIDFWNSSDAIWNRTDPSLGWLGGAILLLSSLSLLPSWRLLLTYLTGIAAMELLQQVRYEGAPRHWGHYFIFFVALCWLLRAGRPRRRHLPSLLVLLIALGFQLQGFVAATVWDTREVFSGGRATAAFIRRNRLQDLPIIAGPSWQVLTVTSYLRRPFISVETEEIHETVVFHNRRRWFSMPELVTRAAALAREHHGPILAIVNEPLAPMPPDITSSLLFQSRPSTIDDEVFLVHRLVAMPH